MLVKSCSYHPVANIGANGIGKLRMAENGLVAYNYKSLNVIMKDNRVLALESNTSAAKTKRNIHQDSTLNDVLKAYGSDVMKTAYEDLMLYEYDKPDDNNRPCRLRFAIDKNNKVRYITIRML